MSAESTDTYVINIHWPSGIYDEKNLGVNTLSLLQFKMCDVES